MSGNGSIDETLDLNDSDLCIWKIISVLHPEYDKEIIHEIDGCDGYSKKCPDYLPQKRLYDVKEDFKWRENHEF